jgi:hypothetical protein
MMIPWKMHSDLRFRSQEAEEDQSQEAGERKKSNNQRDSSEQERRPDQNPHSLRGSNNTKAHSQIRGMTNPKLNVFIVTSWVIMHMNVGRRRLTLADMMQIILTPLRTMKTHYSLLVMFLKRLLMIFGC